MEIIITIIGQIIGAIIGAIIGYILAIKTIELEEKIKEGRRFK